MIIPLGPTISTGNELIKVQLNGIHIINIHPFVPTVAYYSQAILALCSLEVYKVTVFILVIHILFSNFIFS